MLMPLGHPEFSFNEIGIKIYNFHSRKLFRNVVCKMSAIFFQPEGVKSSWPTGSRLAGMIVCIAGLAEAAPGRGPVPITHGWLPPYSTPHYPGHGTPIATLATAAPDTVQQENIRGKRHLLKCILSWMTFHFSLNVLDIHFQKLFHPYLHHCQ